MRASFQKDFKVAETVGKAAEGPNSLLALNNKITAVTDPTKTAEIFDPMWHLCLACANQRKLIAKVRGDSNDFLTYATMGYIDRWQKQFGEYDARRPVQQIQNWIPYILGTIRFALIQYNKDQYDYDFLPLPRLMEDGEGENSSERDVLDQRSIFRDPLMILALETLAQGDVLHSVLLSLPAEFKPYLLDILYYIRTKGLLMTTQALNFVKLGRVLFGDAVEQWMK